MDNISFSEIYTQYYKISFLFVKSYVRDSMVAEDIVSESIIRLWNMMKNGEVEQPQSLLVTMLRNDALNYLKHLDVRQSAMENITAKLERDLKYRIVTLEASDPKEIFSEEISAIIQRTLARLPEQTRQIFEMSRYEHLSVKEIAQSLNLTPKAVEYHITKSLKSLRIALKDYLPVFFFLFGI